MQVIAQSTNERMFAACTRQESPIGRQRIQGAKESQALDEFTYERIDRDHSFRLQFAERHMNRPTIRAHLVEAIIGKVGAFSDTHAGQTLQQQSVGEQIVAAAQFGLQAT